MTLPTINPLSFEALQAQAGADFVLTLIDAFAEEAPRLLAALRAAATQGDAARFEDAAHTLKCNGATFGATRLAEMARRLEWQGPGTDADGLAGSIDALHVELAAALLALRALAQP